MAALSLLTLMVSPHRAYAGVNGFTAATANVACFCPAENATASVEHRSEEGRHYYQNVSVFGLV